MWLSIKLFPCARCSSCRCESGGTVPVDSEKGDCSDMTSAKRFAKIIFMIMLVLIPVSGICGCGSVQQEKTEQKEIHVSAAGSDETGEGGRDHE